MDTYRGNFVDRVDSADDWPDIESHDDDIVRETPPSPVGQDERRMQVRAYNHWASLLGDRSFPSIEDLDPDSLPDFGPYSVLLDFTGGIDNPAIQFLGDKLANECGADDEIETLSDVPSRSLLSRITDHYMQILANQAPIGFEAEFVNQREATILYRGILLPFSSDDDTIDFIYGVINWKELADQQTTDELLLEIDQALEVQGPELRHDELTDWADGPAEVSEDLSEVGLAEAELDDANVLDLGGFVDAESAADAAFPEPSFGSFANKPAVQESMSADFAAADDAPATDQTDDWAPLAGSQTDDAADMELADWLASARELAEAARGSEDRTRQALYAAIGRAYDFSLAASAAPEEFSELVADSGLTVQDRAPMTPVVKLVFGADYDKTRLTEYASALSHAHRLGLARGSLADYLSRAPGGLKGVVTEERRAKRAETGAVEEVRDTPREALARKLRELQQFPFEAVPADGSEFTLLIARRLPTGEVVLLGEIGDDVPLLERAARRLLG
ncbi:MAG: hypothetical protein O9296_02585 [Novosphingobium sp.]|nr:hypothetical protein [Novosphingobium sp.]